MKAPKVITKNDLNRYETVCQSGLTGWRQRVQGLFDAFETFEACCESYNNHARLGYKTPRECWDANPVIEGSVIPSDYRKVAD